MTVPGPAHPPVVDAVRRPHLANVDEVFRSAIARDAEHMRRCSRTCASGELSDLDEVSARNDAVREPDEASQSTDGDDLNSSLAQLLSELIEYVGSRVRGSRRNVLRVAGWRPQGRRSRVPVRCRSSDGTDGGRSRMAERKWFKGPAAIAVDEWYGSGDVQANLTYARNVLEQGRDTGHPLPFAEIVAQLVRDNREKAEFVYPLQGGRLQGPVFEGITREGYLQAIGLALGHSPPVPIRSFWMTGAGNTQVEMHISDEAQQVLVTLMVPDVEGGSTDQRYPEAWVVRQDDDGTMETKQTSGPPNPVPPLARHHAG